MKWHTDDRYLNQISAITLADKEAELGAAV